MLLHLMELCKIGTWTDYSTNFGIFKKCKKIDRNYIKFKPVLLKYTTIMEKRQNFIKKKLK